MLIDGTALDGIPEIAFDAQARSRYAQGRLSSGSGERP